MADNNIKDMPFFRTLEARRKYLSGGADSWIEDLRDEGHNRFLSLGFPTRKDEDWKYTSLEPISSREFHLPDDFCMTHMKGLLDFCSSSKIFIVLVNGTFSPELSYLEEVSKGLNIMSLEDAFKKRKDIVRECLEASGRETSGAFDALNKSLIKSGIFIEIQDGKTIEELIHIVCVDSDDSSGVIMCPRNIIVIGESSKASILESHISFGESAYLNNVVTDVTVKKNSHLLWYKLQAESSKAFHIGTTRILQNSQSCLERFTFGLGGALVRDDLYVTLGGEGCMAVINGLYMPASKQHMDYLTSIEHAGPGCSSRQLYKGILTDESRSVFNGKILVKPGAQKTTAYQLNKNLLIDKKCRAYTKPQLEIFADDVKCTHGATVGALNEDEMFYLQSRGIEKKESAHILSRAFAEDILMRVSDINARRTICGIFEEKLTRMGKPLVRCCLL